MKPLILLHLLRFCDCSNPSPAAIQEKPGIALIPGFSCIYAGSAAFSCL
nr:MAG TPA: hypothetical protein [Caudoviricetes sp.]